MTPALIRLHNFEPGKLSTSTFTRAAEAMQIQSALYSRSTTETNSSGGGVGSNTIIFIVLGVVCLLVILIGFCIVSRPRASNAGPNVPSLHLQHLPIIHPPRPRCERDMSEHWKIWRIWRHTSSTGPPTAASVPTSQLSPAPVAITRPPRTRGGSKTHPLIVSRPSQARRVTSLSVATSFSHSHITEEALSDFRASAYDLDGDLETEMLHSARDDVWVGHPLAVEDSCGDVVEEATEARGSATPVIEGGVEGNAPPQWGVGDYENLGACQSVGNLVACPQSNGGDYVNSGACRSVASGNNGVEGDVIEVDKVAMGQALQ